MQVDYRRVYETDKRSAEVCRRMQHVGIQYDVKRAKEFSDVLREKENEAVKDAEAALGRPLERTKTGGIKPSDLKHAFFTELGVPGFWLSELTGQPSLSKSALQAYAVAPDKALSGLAQAELARRNAVKIRSTYIDGVINATKAGKKGQIVLDEWNRIHPTWQNYGTVSGRWSCAGPNLANLPRAATDPLKAFGGIRSLYHARDGFVLVYYDKSQIEFRVAAYASGDEAMIATCEGGDVHSGNAAAIFGDAFSKDEYKRLKSLQNPTPEEKARFTQLDNLRTLAKSAVFAVCYMAVAQTVYDAITAQGVRTTLRRVEAMLQLMQRKYQTYYRWQDDLLMEAIRTGYVSTPLLGRVRYVGHNPGVPEVANFPIQGGAADIMNAELYAVAQMLQRVSPKSDIIAHVYDSVLIECPENEADDVVAEVRAISLAPVEIGGRRPVLKIDLDVLERWK